jgi:hypothetical protein
MEDDIESTQSGSSRKKVRAENSVDAVAAMLLIPNNDFANVSQSSLALDSGSLAEPEDITQTASRLDKGKQRMVDVDESMEDGHNPDSAETRGVGIDTKPAAPAQVDESAARNMKLVGELESELRCVCFVGARVAM